jgi:anti-sigma factor RsiW
MTGTVEKFSEREEIEMLLPWYVTGKLDAADRTRVERWLAREPAMVRQLELIREEQQASVVANAAVEVPERLRPQSVATQAVSATAGPISWLPGLAGAIGDFFRQPTAGAVRWAAAAVAAVIIAQAAVIGVKMWSPSPGYETASGPNRVARGGLVVLVAFKETASIKDVAAALSSIDAAIVDGPRAGGLFRVRLSATPHEGQAATDRIEVLRRQTSVVARVLPQTSTGGR